MPQRDKWQVVDPQTGQPESRPASRTATRRTLAVLVRNWRKGRERTARVSYTVDAALLRQGAKQATLPVYALQQPGQVERILTMRRVQPAVATTPDSKE